MLYKVILTFKSIWVKSILLSCGAIIIIMLRKVVLTLESMDEVLKGDHSNDIKEYLSVHLQHPSKPKDVFRILPTAHGTLALTSL